MVGSASMSRPPRSDACTASHSSWLQPGGTGSAPCSSERRSAQVAPVTKLRSRMASIARPERSSSTSAGCTTSTSSSRWPSGAPCASTSRASLCTSIRPGSAWKRCT
ncbi:hypothetical protein G6F54_013832 [Rhizopus delemar]|nr:hypothetical protein G6F54_013832 [Rhizopus delemar]